MFRGSSLHTLDGKGRLIIPTRFKDEIRNGSGETGRLIVTRLEKSLYAYTLNGWSRLENIMLAEANFSDNMRRFRRYFVGGASECPLDKQGRILIPPTLRDCAELQREIVLVGQLDHFEIWSKTNWDKENESIENDLQKGAVHAEIARLGL